MSTFIWMYVFCAVVTACAALWLLMMVFLVVDGNPDDEEKAFIRYSVRMFCLSPVWPVVWYELGREAYVSIRNSIKAAYK